MALLVLLLCRELFGFASHSRGDPLITNDVLYQLSYSGFLDPTMAVLVLLLRRELFSFASHSRGDAQITKKKYSIGQAVGFL